MLDREMELEEESRQHGIDAYQRKRAESHEGDMPPGLQLIRRAIVPTAEAISAWTESVRPGPLGHLAPWFRDAPIGYEEMAFLALRTALNCMTLQGARVQTVANRITDALLDSIEYDKFKKQAKGMLIAVENKMNESNSKRRRRILWDAKRRAGVADEDLTADMKFKIGHKLLDVLIEVTGLFTLQTVRHGARSTRVHVKPTFKLLEWLEEGHEVCQELHPFLQPMVVEPLPWSTMNDGGYLMFNHSFVKAKSRQLVKAYGQQDLSRMFAVVNKVQSTPWAVNKPVLAVLEQLAKVNSRVGGLPPTSLEVEIPSPPWGPVENLEYWKERHPEEFQEYKKVSYEAYNDFYRNTSNRIALHFKLAMARKFADDTFWFPYTVDFRGRLYPMVNFLHPQGDDTSRALLRFADGRKLTDRGLWWLKVHLANTFGEDKSSFEDRVAWTEEHHEDIMRSSRMPYDYTWWEEADKPYSFLAACFEYGDLLSGVRDETYLPIQMDGSCNGLQHLSAMLRDERGGSSVNLTPGDKPSDIYSEVASESLNIMHEHLEDPELREYACFWIPKMNRKLTKRNTMTLPYGVSKYGMVDQLLDETKNQVLPDGSKYYGDINPYKYCDYLGSVNWEATGRVIKAARVLMDWFRDVAEVVVEAGHDVGWSTPTGFKVLPMYRKLETKRIYTFSGKMRVAFSVGERGSQRDGRKVRQSLSPNIIHSFDAAHLCMVVEELADAGLTSFSLIHDSYGVHAPDVDLLHEKLRSTFVKIYDKDVLQQFKKEVEDAVDVELPEVPEYGSLDVSQVLDSKYFFN